MHFCTALHTNNNIKVVIQINAFQVDLLQSLPIQPKPSSTITCLCLDLAKEPEASSTCLCLDAAKEPEPFNYLTMCQFIYLFFIYFSIYLYIYLSRRTTG